MKKFIATLLLLVPLSALAVDDFGLNVPQWKDFAPSAFYDVKEPRGLFSKLNVTAKYWYDRRVVFERSVAECKALEDHDARFSCYEELKIKQFRENTDYNARIDASRQASSDVNGMNNMTNTMVPINGYLDAYTRMMPNELRGY